MEFNLNLVIQTNHLELRIISEKYIDDINTYFTT